MKYNKKNLEKLKFFVKERVNGHNVYTNPNIFTGALSSEVFRKSDKFCVWFNIEIVFLLLSKYNIKPNKIKFIGDDDDKKKMWVENFGVEYINHSEESIKNMKFTYSLMNPAFDYSVNSLKRAKEITEEKVLFIGPTRDFDKSDMLEDLEYFEHLGTKAFDETIMTALAIYNQNGVSETTIKFNDGRKEVVDKLLVVPGESNYDDWKFATKVLSMNLPSYNAGGGYIGQSKAEKVDKDGIQCIWRCGKVGGDFEWDMIHKKHSDKVTGLGEHKIIVSKMTSKGNLGDVKYAGPEYGVGDTCYRVALPSKQECLKAIEYLNSQPVRKLVRGLKTTTASSSNKLWSKIPLHTEKDKWI